jgi:glycerate 2-kinase
MFDKTVLENDPSRRSLLLDLLSAALEAADPALAVRRSLRREGSRLEIAGETLDLSEIQRVSIIALGKASPAMGRAAWSVLDGIKRRMLVVSDHSEDLPAGASFVQAGHPLPTEDSRRAASMALALAQDSGPNDLVLCLISGGGSALAEMPADGLSLEDLRSVGRSLLEKSVAIDQVNTVRRHLSAFKGGRLAEAAAPARLITLVLSDVIGNQLSSIASGPTVGDSSTFDDAIRILADHRLLDEIPKSARDHLERGRKGLIPDTPVTVPHAATTIIGDLTSAVQAVRRTAEAAGIDTAIATTTLSGEAAPTARRCIGTAGPGLTVFAGETTVTILGSGSGGRNQEGALSAAKLLDGNSSTVFVTFATDGVDGPTEAAGAIVDGATVARGRVLGLDVDNHLQRNDSNPFLRATGDLLVTGPTGTNVGDIWMVLEKRP